MVQFTDCFLSGIPITSTALIYSDFPKSNFKKQLAEPQVPLSKYASFVRASVDKLRALTKDLLAPLLLLIMEVVSTIGFRSQALISYQLTLSSNELHLVSTIKVPVSGLVQSYIPVKSKVLQSALFEIEASLPILISVLQYCQSKN